MSNRTITIKIPLNDNNSTRNQNINNTVDSMMKKINQIKQSVLSLRDSGLENEQIRDQYIIHSQQCTEDRDILSKIYKNLKFKFEHQNDEPIQAKSEDIQRQEDSALPVTQAKTIPTYEFISREPSICKVVETQQINAIRVRYEISVSTSIYNIQFSPDGNLIAFSDSSHVFIIQSSDGELLTKIDINPNDCRLPDNLVHSTDFLTKSHCMRFSPDGKFLSVANGSNVLLYSIQSDMANPPNLVYTFNHSNVVTALVFNSSGKWLITGSGEKIYVWDMVTRENLYHFNHDVPSGTSIVSIATPPDTSMYFVAFSNGTIGIYNEAFEPPMVSFNANSNSQFYLLDAEISPVFDETIVTCSSDSNAKVWAMRGIATCKFTLSGHNDAVTSAAFCPVDNAPILFTACGPKDKRIRAWQHKTGELLYSMELHTDGISQIVSHPSQPILASCGRDGLVCLWEYDVS